MISVGTFVVLQFQTAVFTTYSTRNNEGLRVYFTGILYTAVGRISRLRVVTLYLVSVCHYCTRNKGARPTNTNEDPIV